jgi:hypothetical protein
MRTILSLAILSVWGAILNAQEDTIAYEIFNSNSLEFAVMADGRLFHTPDGGGDLVSTVRDDGGSGLGFAGLWLTDLSPGQGFRYVSHEEADEDNTFMPGIIHSYSEGAELQEVIPTNKVWRVTRADIRAHIADIGDNLQIDNPVPAAIMAWPGAGNPHFAEYNDMPDLPAGIDDLAPFEDYNLDGLYNPMDGDYPITPISVGCPNLSLPDEMFWVSFTPKLSYYGSIEVNLLGQIYYCGEENGLSADRSTLSHTLVLDYLIRHEGLQVYENFVASLFLDFLPACGGGYVGFRPAKSTVYHYAPNFAADCPRRTPNIVAVRALDRPVYESASNTLEEADYNTCMRFLPAADTVEGYMQYPSNGVQMRNYATGRWRNGIPLSYGGDGYSTVPTPDTVKGIFFGSPNIPLEWNASDADLPPGRRMALLSTEPYRFNVLNQNRLRYVITLPHQGSSFDSLEEAGGLFESAFNEVDFMVRALFCDPIWSITCPRLNNTEEAISPGEAALHLSPNPAGQQVSLRVEGGHCERYRIFNLQGQLVHERLRPQREETLDVSDWQPGVYFVQAIAEDGMLVRQLLVE